MNAFDIAINTLGFRKNGAVEGECSYWHKLADFFQKRTINLFAGWLLRGNECAQKSVGAELFGCKFIAGHPKSEGINAVAVLLVNQVILELGRSRGSCDKAAKSSLKDASHDVSSFLSPTFPAVRPHRSRPLLKQSFAHKNASVYGILHINIKCFIF